MQAEPRYGLPASRPRSPRSSRSGSAFAVAQGIHEERVCLDPGIGFGKTVAHNLDCSPPRCPPGAREAGARRLLAQELPASVDGIDDLLGASVAAAVAAFERGATILRVHDVRPHVDALTVAAAVA